MNVPRAILPRGVVFEPPVRLNELAETQLFDNQTLKGVVLWSSRSPGAAHTRQWRTGFKFVARCLVGEDPDATQGPSQTPPLVTFPNRVQLPAGTYGGISVEISQPFAHQYMPPGTAGVIQNLYGTLKIFPRLEKLLFSDFGDFFSIDFKPEVTVTVEDLHNLMFRQGRQYYTFHPQGQGCGSLYWQLQLMEAFVTVGWIDRARLDVVYTQIRMLSLRPSSGVYFPPIMGLFYAPPRGMPSAPQGSEEPRRNIV